MSAPEFVDPQGDVMVPLLCPCGEQIGVRSPGWHAETDPAVVARCYACAAVEEAERITGGAA